MHASFGGGCASWQEGARRFPFWSRVSSAAGRRSGAEVVIVPLYVGGDPSVEDLLQLADFWVAGLPVASGRKGLLEAGSVNGGSE